MVNAEIDQSSHDSKLARMLEEAAQVIADSCDIGVVLNSPDAEVGRVLKHHLARVSERSRATADATSGADKDDSASGGSF
ncbi:hypothetical protein [Paraburkholderia sp. HD33-4]|uniref:hypothetical protein n=1 Tax=Paraburkholderia sp. HD33-4 TaxID=2883242 RepID=UPI001F46F242|nr:hypothetical protein [Paraburkholderia sp. HD33-4]